MGSEHHHKSHCVFNIKLHIVLVCKYRKKLLKDEIDTDIKNLLKDAAKSKNFSIEAMETNLDYIHILVDINQTQSALDIVRHLKQISTYYIWKKHEQELKKHFVKEKTFWNDGYFVRSTGDAITQTIIKHIQRKSESLPL